MNTTTITNEQVHPPCVTGLLGVVPAWVWCLLEQSTGMDPTVVSGDGRNRAPNWGNLAWKEYCFFSPDVKETKTTTLPLTASKKKAARQPQ